MRKKNKNAFTLIELLAVIVILAVIALIATPIILGIVEDAKKDAFLRSVELLVSATDIDVINKLSDGGYHYELIDGSITDDKQYSGLKIIEFDMCLEILTNEGAPTEEATVLCRNQPSELIGGFSLLDFINSADSLGEEAIEVSQYFIGLGIIVDNYDYNDLNLAKNTQGINGSIVYTKDGIETYAIYNDVYCVIKTEDMIKAEISDYKEGQCLLSLANGEALAVITSKVAKMGDVETYENGQLINLGAYGIRYQGYDPDNYIYFNCSDYNDQTADTCEIWRIIGIVDGKVKIISEEIGTMSWDDKNGDGYWDSDVDINDWNNSTLKNYLNGEAEGNYYASLTKATRDSELISLSTWYLKGQVSSEITKDVMYDIERTTGLVYGSNLGHIDDAKIGLMYPSDWGFAAMETSTCLATTLLYDYETCKASNWINQGSINHQWLITPYSYLNAGVYIAFLPGNINTMNVVSDNSRGVRPVLYLSSNARIEGEGNSTSPFKLKVK